MTPRHFVPVTKNTVSFASFLKMPLSCLLPARGGGGNSSLVLKPWRLCHPPPTPPRRCTPLSPPPTLLFTEEIILLVSCCTCFILATRPLSLSRARLLYFKVSNIQGWFMINLLCLSSLSTTALISKFLCARFLFAQLRFMKNISIPSDACCL